MPTPRSCSDLPSRQRLYARARRCLAGMLLGFAAFVAPASATGWPDNLPTEVRTPLEAAGIGADAVAIWVAPLDAPAPPRLNLNGDQSMNPASVMKLITSFAALDRLGPGHVWQTRLTLARPPRDGVLDGSMYLIGGGDPTFGYERLWKLLRQARQAGVERIRGDIVLDDSVFRLPPHDPGVFDGRPLRPYNAGPGGLVLNFSALRVTLLPEGGGERVRLLVDPPLAGLRVHNQLRLQPGPCELWYRDLDARLERDDKGERLVVTGDYRPSCGRRDWNVAPLAPARFNAALVDALWRELGGQLEGRVRVGTTPAGLEPLLVDDSPPLADVVRDMNKWSNNLQARQLLVTLGARQEPDAADMVAAGARAARAQLAAAGIDTTSLVIENGSGLSRGERVSARLLAEVLTQTWRRPFMPEFYASLPVVGVDGTTRKRLNGSPALGQAALKTGTIDGVRAIAGYVLDRNGRRHAVAMLVNHPNAASARGAQDALVEWVWRGD